jgi:hypothetical protein
MKILNSLLVPGAILLFIVTALHLETLWVRWILESFMQKDFEYLKILIYVLAAEFFIIPIKYKQYAFSLLILSTLCILIIK